MVMATHPLWVQTILIDYISKCHFTTTEGPAESTWVACGVAALEATEYRSNLAAVDPDMETFSVASSSVAG